MTTATFSNGYTDSYKGNRAVKAAWAIIDRATGETLMSGHSLDRVRAQKTAKNNVHHAVEMGGKYPLDVPTRLYAGSDYTWLYEKARKVGYGGRNSMGEYKRFARAYNADLKAKKMAKVNIEVVDI